jgi:3-methyladenine DNA glycosylase AlkD
MPDVATPPDAPTAEGFVEQLFALRSDEQREKIQRYFKTGEGDYAETTRFIGVRMGDVFRLAKAFIDLPLDEIERLLDHDVHEVRAGGLSVMDKQARRKRTAPERGRELCELYLRRHDRIDTWDLVDLAAPHVVGGWLYDRPRDVLDELAASPVVWERRTAVVATLSFVRQGDLDDTFRLAERLLHDEHDLIHKPVGGMLREVGKHDRQRLLDFLDEHSAVMPRTMLRYAMEHLDPDVRAHYRKQAADRTE